MTEPLKAGESLRLEGEWQMDQNAPSAPFQFLEVNGFIYRCNKITGEMWRLGVKAGDKKIQIWTLIEDAERAH